MNSLSDNVTLHSLFLELKELSDLSVVLFALHLFANKVASESDSVHHFRLEQVIVRVELEALMKELKINLSS